MLKKIRLILYYKCYPVWLYDEHDDIIDTLLPEELRTDTELDAKFDDLQARYDALFIDTPHEFSFIGFKSDSERERFFLDWKTTVNELEEKTKGKYPITDEIDKSLK